MSWLNDLSGLASKVKDFALDESHDLDLPFDASDSVELLAQIKQKDAHISMLETTIIELRKSSLEIATLKDKLSRAAIHLRQLNQENITLKDLQSKFIDQQLPIAVDVNLSDSIFDLKSRILDLEDDKIRLEMCITGLEGQLAVPCDLSHITDSIVQVDKLAQCSLQLSQSDALTLAQQHQILQTAYSELQESTLRLPAESETSVSHIDAISELTETQAKTMREMQRLRHHLIEAEEIHTQEALKQHEVAIEFRAQIEGLIKEKCEFDALIQDEREVRMVLGEDLREAKEECVRLAGENVRLKGLLTASDESLTNLQSVLETFQADKSSESEKANKGFNDQINALQEHNRVLQARVNVAEGELSLIDASSEDIEKLKIDLADKNKTMGKLRHDIIQYQSHLSEALKRMNNEDSVDRPLISNLLLQYISAPRGEKTRVEMLSVLGSILKFNDEDRKRCGLGNNSTFTTTKPEDRGIKETFTDMWISFLQKETSNPDLSGGSSVAVNGAQSYGRRRSSASFVSPDIVSTGTSRMPPKASIANKQDSTL